MHHQGCRQVVVGTSQRRGRRWAGYLPGDAGFADEPGNHRGQRPELSVPVRFGGLVDGSVQVRLCSRLARVGAGVEAGKQAREKQHIPDGEDARAVPVAVKAGTVVGQFRQGDVQRLGQAGEGGEPHRQASALLDLGDELAEPGAFGQFFLGHSLLPAGAPEPVTDRGFVVHEPRRLYYGFASSQDTQPVG